jgi:hypothetical protein
MGRHSAAEKTCQVCGRPARAGASSVGTSHAASVRADTQVRCSDDECFSRHGSWIDNK